MLKNIKDGAYSVVSIISTGGRVGLYTAMDEHENRYTVNQITSSELIKQNLPEIKRLEDEEKLICSLEGDGLCILTPYISGETAAVYMEREKPSVIERIRLVKEYLFALISLRGYPDIILQSAQHAENVVIYNNSLHVNLFIIDDEALSINEIVKSFFTTEQIKKIEKLKIIIRKLDEGVYIENTELYREFDTLARSCDENTGLMGAVLQKKAKLQSVGKKLFKLAAVVIALYVLYGCVAGLRDKSDKQFAPVSEIGTVKIINTTEYNK